MEIEVESPRAGQSSNCSSRARHSLGPTMDAELAVQMDQVRLDRALLQHQLVRNVRVRAPGGEQAQHVQLAGARGFAETSRLRGVGR